TALGSTSDFSNCLVPLPVTIISFTAQKLNDHTAVLEWQTGNEKNNDYFIIERSSDGINFESIGTIKGAGSSTNFLSYSFTDENPFQDINYYRLKQVDFNGQSENSVIRIVNFGASALALVSNGLDYYITVSSNENIQVNYTIYSAEGREVRTGNSVMGGNIKKALLDLSGLSTAVYYIKINAGENFIADKLFVK
ncbi:MAG TPA: T9SS type A sorting domain-containing protein, partial [Cytophagaceae bacterium]|nr:T9SS type A sorting domain-containing protein [Cytophagaceae bacterium]